MSSGNCRKVYRLRDIFKKNANILGKMNLNRRFIYGIILLTFFVRKEVSDMTGQSVPEKQPNNPHAGHRERRKDLFREHGLDSFADHEVLELLLFFAQPRQDTNPTAHLLLKRFGSLGAVFSAPYEELASVEGVGENTATLLSLLLPSVRRAYLTSMSCQGIPLGDNDRLGRYVCSLFFGVRQEVFYEICLDAKSKLLRCCKVADGSVSSVNVDIRCIVENALRCHASSVVLSHNHPSGIALPSADDNTLTLAANDALRCVGVKLTDHIIVADNDFVSLRDNGLLD